MYYDPYGLWAWGDPLPNWLVDPLVGIGDGVSFGLTRRIRQMGGFDTGYNRCSSLYMGGQFVGASLPLSRLGYVSQVSKIPSKFSSATRANAEKAYNMRNQIANYYRGFLGRFYRQKGSFEFYAKKYGNNWEQIIKKAGTPNWKETSRILALAPAGYARIGIDYANDSGECGCQ